VEILTKTDKPVLLSASADGKLTRSIAVAWDGGESACHAITGALPFLSRAKAVTVLHIGEQLNDQKSAYSARSTLGELKEYLGLHGIAVTVRNFESGAKSTGEALLDAALAIGADLLVMGGYSHSRLRESVFGGVTAHIRWHAQLPVLMVH
jgi:nucleotide-binding universal stress UspA family protein